MVGSTPQFDRFVENETDKQIRNSEMGVVTKVFAHDSSDDNSNHEVNVRLTTGIQEFRRIPVHVGRSGESYVPQEDDFVEVSFLHGTTQKPYVSGFAYDVEQRAPLGKPGHYRQRFGDSSPYLFVEAEPSDHSEGPPDVVRIAKKSDGLSDPTDEIVLDDSGSSTNATVDVTGDVTINADGNVTVTGGTIQVDGDSVVLGDGGTDLLTDVTVSTTEDADGHVTSVSLSKSRSSTTETQ